MNQKYRIIVAGGRDLEDYELVHSTLFEYINHFLDLGSTDSVEIVSGRARGADRLGEKFADEYGYPVKCFEADWQKYGKAAGPIRNNDMAEYASEDGYYGVLIAFWDCKSRGTQNMIDIAERYRLDVKIVGY